MLSGHGSAWRRRRNSRAARIAVPLAIPMALGLTLGIILAVSGGNTTTIAQSALGSCASAAASAAPAASGSQAAPAADASAPAARPAPRPRVPAPRPRPARPRRSPARRHPAQRRRPHRRRSQPPSRAFLPSTPRAAPAWPARTRLTRPGTRSALPRPQAEAADSTNCTVTVPDRPLTAKGLATPWVLGDGCTWANGGTEGVFIDATILAPNGQVQVYNPLVINQGTTPAVAPTPPTIARGFAGHPQRRVQRQRAGPGRPGRAAGQLHRRLRQLADEPDAAVQRGQLLPDGQLRDRPRPAEDPGHRHRQGRPGLPDHA